MLSQLRARSTDTELGESPTRACSHRSPWVQNPWRRLSRRKSTTRRQRFFETSPFDRWRIASLRPSSVSWNIAKSFEISSAVPPRQ